MDKKYKEEKTQTKATGTQYQLICSLGGLQHGEVRLLLTQLGRLNRTGYEKFSDRNNVQNWVRAYT